MTENAVTYFLLWYVVMGLLSAMMYLYTSKFKATIEEFALIWFFWLWVVVMIIHEHGFGEVVESGFTRDKRGFFVRMLIAACVLTILFSIVSILA